MGKSYIQKHSFNQAIVGDPPRPFSVPLVSDLKYGEFSVNASLGLVYLRKKGYFGDPFNTGVDLVQPIDTIIQLASMNVQNYGDFLVTGTIKAKKILVEEGVGSGEDSSTDKTYIEYLDDSMNFFVNTIEVANFLEDEIHWKVPFLDLCVIEELIVGKDPCNIFQVENGRVGIGNFDGDMAELLHVKHGNVRIDHGHLYVWGRIFVKGDNRFEELTPQRSLTHELTGDYTIQSDDLRKNFQLKSNTNIVITLPSAILYEGFEIYIHNLSDSGTITITPEIGTDFICIQNVFSNKFDWCRIYKSNQDSTWYGMNK
jgi:hypothetical protein